MCPILGGKCNNKHTPSNSKKIFSYNLETKKCEEHPTITDAIKSTDVKRGPILKNLEKEYDGRYIFSEFPIDILNINKYFVQPQSKTSKKQNS